MKVVGFWGHPQGFGNLKRGVAEEMVELWPQLSDVGSPREVQLKDVMNIS